MFATKTITDSNTLNRWTEQGMVKLFTVRIHYSNNEWNLTSQSYSLKEQITNFYSQLSSLHTVNVSCFLGGVSHARKLTPIQQQVALPIVLLNLISSFAANQQGSWETVVKSKCATSDNELGCQTSLDCKWACGNWSLGSWLETNREPNKPYATVYF